MIKNYLITAIRNFWKNKLFSFINIFGLAIGLAVFVFANLFADYEETHDKFFQNSDRIYALRTDINPAARLGITSIDASYTAISRLIPQEIPEIQKVATSAWTEMIISRGDNKFYQSTHFVDPEFLDIFKFEFLTGNPDTALQNTNSVVLTEQTAIKYFGHKNVLGETLTLNNDRDMRVTGVIEDLPLNSHLAQNLITDEKLEMLVNSALGSEIFGEDFLNNWNNLSTNNRTYVLLPEGVDPAPLEPRLDAIVDNYGPDNTRDIVSRIGFRPLADMNLLIWHAIGIPGITIMRFLGLLVLAIASINFINLATAQALGRAREIGIRKTMGASRGRLAAQFLVESVVITFFALVIAIVAIEYALPEFNNATNKIMEFPYFRDPSLMAFLILTVFGVGLVSGSFPAFLLARLEASNALKGNMALGKWGLRFRKFLVVSQNTFSVFLIISVMISYFQVQALQNRDLGFDDSNTQVLLRINREGVNENYRTLKTEIERVEGVRAVTGASQYPYEQSNSSGKFNTVREQASAKTLATMSIDFNFLQTFDIPLVAGRQLSEDYAADTFTVESGDDPVGDVNVIISRKAVRAMGWENPEDALGQTIYGMSGNAGGRSMVVVGVSEDFLIQGFHNEQKPFLYFARPQQFSALLVKTDPARRNEAIEGLEAAWNRVLPDFPIIRLSLDEAFEDVFSIFRNINNALLGFAIMALAIATVGLFGLSAFMAEKRIREVGIRKTFGASTGKIVKLMTFQFSRPVLWAILFGWVLAFLGHLATEGFFSQVMPMDIKFFMIFVLGGVFSLVLAWITVGANAYRAANTNPINTLSYE